MNAEVKKLWIDDLRAHPELQGRERMKSGDGTQFCCLGRLCELALIAGVELPEWYIEYDADEMVTSNLR